MLADVLILDLDGVVYIGPDAVPHAIEALNALATSGIRLTAATNNASRPAEEVGQHLRRLGLEIEDHDVVTSAQAAAEHLAARLEPGAQVLAIGGPGVAQSLGEVGLVPLRASVDLAESSAAADAAQAVLMGYGPLVAWYDLAAAQWAIDRGKYWVATNGDPTVPQPYGRAPGNGAFVALLERSTGRTPIVIGKPQPALFSTIMRRTAATQALVVGDRLDTDVDGALASGVRSVFILTGVQTLADLADRPRSRWPDYIALDMRSLLLPPVIMQLDASGQATSDAPNALTAAIASVVAGASPAGVQHAGALPLIDVRALRRDTVAS